MSDLEQVYGIHAVSALLAHHPKRVRQLWLAQGRQDASVAALRERALGRKIGGA
jgi:23S rRNA (guanosine2251-2'-O)-methyltransferase